MADKTVYMSKETLEKAKRLLNEIALPNAHGRNEPTLAKLVEWLINQEIERRKLKK